ncbi:unnamed protein product [Urochloa humidicola]
MEELDEFEVLWPETWGHVRAPPPPPSSSPVPPAQVAQPSEARSLPVDVPIPKAAPRARRWSGGHDDAGNDAKDIVPPHLLLSSRRRSEAWTLRASGPPCKRERDLRHLRDYLLRMHDRLHYVEG